MAKADGQIIIDTLIDTKGTSKDTIDLQEQFEKLAKRVEAISRKINEALKTIDAKPVSKNVNEALGDVDPDKAVEPIQEGLDNIDASKVPEEVNQELGNIDATAPVAEINGALDGVDASGLDTEISEPIEEGFEKARESSKENTEKIKEDIDGVGKESEETGDKLGNALAAGFKKVGAAVAAFAVAKVAGQLSDLGKQAIELASDLEEVQNVVDVTFTTMSKEVNQFAKDAQKSAGMSETMAKRYVGMFGAMADSFGYAEEEAYEMSTTLTQLAGDVASFYNLTQDEAISKLKGVFTGESEALKELGVVMTQTALDAYALENGFSKTTAAMTEQEKVSLRYSFVLDQLSAASGDFVRTQDSWANQAKVLSLQWETLLATIGGGLINALTPALEFVNSKVIPGLQRIAESIVSAFAPTAAEELNAAVGKLSGSVAAAEAEFDAASKEIAETSIKAQYYAKRLKELEKAGLATAEAQQEYVSLVELLNELYPELNLKISEQTGLLDDNSRAMLDNVDALKEQALQEAKERRYNDMLASRQDLIDEVAESYLDLNELRAEEQILVENLAKAQEKLSEEYLKTASAYEVENYIIPAYTEAELALQANRQAQQDLEQAIADANTAIDAQGAKIKGYAAEVGASTVATNNLANSSESTAQALTTMGTATEEITATVQALREEYDAARESARDSIDSQIGYFDELVVESDKSADDIVENWNSQKEAFDNYAANLQKAIDMGLDESLVRQLSDGSTESMAILEEFVSGTDMSVDDINAAFEGVSESRDTVSTVMANINTDMVTKLDELKGTTDKAWGEMADVVGAEIERMQRYINTLTGGTVYVDVVTRTRPGTASGSSVANSGNISPYSVSGAAIPYLAQGTVIPPNAPFMAVLGDQRHGTNVEAPLSTIQEAVAAVIDGQMSGMMAGFEAIVSAISNLNDTVSDIEVGDSTIGQAVERYNRHMSIVRGTMQ